MKDTCSKFIFLCITMRRYYDAIAGYLLRIQGSNHKATQVSGKVDSRRGVVRLKGWPDCGP